MEYLSKANSSEDTVAHPSEGTAAFTFHVETPTQGKVRRQSLNGSVKETTSVYFRLAHRGDKPSLL